MVIIIFPDKAALIPVFCDYLITQNFSVLIFCIKIKDKDSLRVQIIIDQGKNLCQVRRICDIVDAVTDGHHSPHSAVQLKLPHILAEIQDILSRLRPLSGCQLQHFF